jgi:hypothetical protein
VKQWFESLTWHSVDAQLPDADTTVLVSAPDCSEPVWLGWYDGVYWFGVDATEYKDGLVKAWAEMPSGLSPERRR